MRLLDKATRCRIEAALAARDMSAALVAADVAIAAGVRDPLLFNLLSWRAEEAGDFATAHRALADAMALDPADPTIVNASGRVLRKEGRIEASLAMFAHASRIAPSFAVPWLERAFALEDAGDFTAALTSYSRAAELDPALAPALAGVAAIAARHGDEVVARAFAERALALDAYDARATCALARCELDGGDVTGAAERIRKLLASAGVCAEDRIAALTLLGDALDRQDAISDAFDQYTAAKAMVAALHARRFTGQEPQRAFIEGVTARVEALDPAVWRAQTAPMGHGPAEGHVFLIGYPRSGTTLVENILASASGVVALEERSTLADAHEYLLDDDGIDRLARLDTDEIERLRDAYWARVNASGMSVSGKIFVDMDPLKGLKLPLIARLFPDAAIIILYRDPRDVVLSCFRQNFRISAAAYAFTTLDETARHYAALMALTSLCLERMPIMPYLLRYDAIVADFDRTTRSLCAFVGAEWSPELRRFDKTAARRGVATASASQVRRGLYDGSGQWRRYAAHLATVGPILQPWLERLGFEPAIGQVAVDG